MLLSEFYYRYITWLFCLLMNCFIINFPRRGYERKRKNNKILHDSNICIPADVTYVHAWVVWSRNMKWRTVSRKEGSYIDSWLKKKILQVQTVSFQNSLTNSLMHLNKLCNNKMKTFPFQIYVCVSCNETNKIICWWKQNTNLSK